jgi:polyribonucleotide nucleotidyltransferase
MDHNSISVVVGEETITFETGKMAKLANGAVLVKAGETFVLGTACAALEPTPSIDFLPLRVDYQEKFSSAGKTLGGFIKREGRPTERETLVSRLIDRPLRPMFEDGYYNETQVLTYVLSYDKVNSPEPLALCAASAALVISDIPLIKPIGAVRVGLINDKFVINPTLEHQKESKLDLMIAGTEDAVLMIEGYCDFLTEEKVLEAIETGHKGIQIICEALSNWQKAIGKPKNRAKLHVLPKEVNEAVLKIAQPLLETAMKTRDKKERQDALRDIKTAVHDQLLPKTGESKFNATDVGMSIKKVTSDYMRHMILKEKVRIDGRKSTDIRKISIEQGVLPRVHGSSLFTRGETQALAVCTLGGQSMGQRFEDLNEDGIRRFYLQYTFPPFSVGEVGRMGAPGRREIGHGKLAERSIAAALPSLDKFPYTIRLESNILESNGSSSMASVCGGCLALMDAGVPITRPVSGIAMGLILEGNDFVILSDILGDEDALGDMDFKVSGDQNGITAFQMDIKIEGITHEIMRLALAQAKEGRVHILKKMIEVCPQSNTQMSAHAPRIETMKIKPSKIAIVIGPGGKQIRAIIDETGVELDIDDDGTVNITSPDQASIEMAKSIILGLTADVEVGQIYTGRITSVVPFGVFVELLPGKEGLCHISEYDTTRIAEMRDVAKEGDVITVKVMDINDRGQLKLSRKVLLGVPQ